jgi:signal peptidase I
LGQAMNKAEPGIEVSSWWLRLIVGRRPVRTLVRLLIVVGLTLILFRVLFIPIRVTGNSMEPTYVNGRINFINRLAYVRRQPERGDVVAILMEDSRYPILKRVLGLPGESIVLRNGQVAVNGEFLQEGYVRGVGLSRELRTTSLDESHYFVIGDNREVTAYGNVTLADIKGKVLF